jgi:putative transcriptional regulator
MRFSTFCLGLAAGLAFAAGVRAADIDQAPVLLVAKPQLGDFYRNTVLFARPMANGAHIGFIVNRPTNVSMKQIFPEHLPSQKITEPVFLGGPLHTDSVFAVVQQAQSPGGRTIALARDMFLVMDAQTVDQVIERSSDHARFYVGMVVWRPGELAQELSSGFWFVLDHDAGLVFRKTTDGLWEELVGRSRRML